MNFAVDHAKCRAVSNHADTLITQRSRLHVESKEIGHHSISVAHEKGYDRLFKAHASEALSRRKLQKVIEKWDLLRDKVESIIPLDEDIASQAVELANYFIQAGNKVKGTRRNTMNDMFIAATAFVHQIPLVTGDKQLKGFYEARGWRVRDDHTFLIAMPARRATGLQTASHSRRSVDQYVNRPNALRSHQSWVPPFNT